MFLYTQVSCKYYISLELFCIPEAGHPGNCTHLTVKDNGKHAPRIKKWKINCVF